MNSNISNAIKLLIYESIKKSAYYKWLEAGCPNGKDIDFWLEAEKNYYKPKVLTSIKPKGLVDSITENKSNSIGEEYGRTTKLCSL